ncbi:double-strand break repair protein AddB [Pseudooceanicola sp. HF7]|uniref:double-strand break repair protein AddB n=1 Tax=Pseudooceanicola sp. HF7 TaxID=2721560 RepID=UPI0014303DEC|nr:double-strand break repair protein AddB [Pseudooceanicola sp. HF7]NIZ09607.1 double-strand break repair protein AddB [Pseudooceanicola sp. HF7]
MFDPSDKPRIFGLPSGADFPRALLRGLQERMADQPPHAMARVQLVVNTRRMSRRIRAIFDAGPPGLLPRLQLLTDLTCAAPIPPSVSPIRRRLELIRLISALLDAEPELAPRASLYDLADSLAKLLDEMQGEKVTPEDIAALDVSDLSGHWARAQRFLEIVNSIPRDDDVLDPEARQRRMIETLIAEWDVNPPQHPILLAGSTGSRGATHLLMQAIARLPQGAVILPGFDFDQPDHVWERLDDPLKGEDHPQYRFRKLMLSLGVEAGDVSRWTDNSASNQARNKLISLALRPAPVTHQWLTEGPGLGDLTEPTKDITLIKAPSPRAEAMAIALRLRQAAEDGQMAALITPDRMLTRQVSSALARWGILPDDSAGIPLQLTPAGRLLRQVARLFSSAPTAVELLTLLKHPLVHTASYRLHHLTLTRRLELYLRANARPQPSAEDIRAFALKQSNEIAGPWAEWLCACFLDSASPGPQMLSDRTAAHRALAERISHGSMEDGTGTLWARESGEAAQALMESLAQEAPYGGEFSSYDYASLFDALISGGELRNADTPHPHILIWGTLEARVQGADLVILGGLNEGTWPEASNPDPWLNRQMRQVAGLLLPERQIGLSAHDFQQAVGAREVWLSRAVRSQDAETVPSRWLNRLTNLLGGLGEEGQAALHQMEANGDVWLAHARLVEAPVKTPPAPRPAPAPPVAARPRELWATDVQRLIRDPYAIYARRILRLRKLNPLMREPDAMLRGIVSHEVIERFVKDVTEGRCPNDPDALIKVAEEVLSRDVPWGETRALWRARLSRIAPWFTAHETARQEEAAQILAEKAAKTEIRELGFTLAAKADRVDLDHAGRYHLFDYKTGAPPSKEKQTYFDKQLLLEAAIAERSGFGEIGPRPVARAVYIGLGTKPVEMPAPLDDEPPGKIWEEFTELVRAWLEPNRGYVARRAMFEMTDESDYDQLARHGEWDVTQQPDRRPVE